MHALLSLGFDTSSGNCRAALVRGAGVLAAREIEMARGQAEHLFPILQDVLSEAGRTWQDLDVIGVGVGPGNFTGIRISVAAARGLGLSLNIPVVGVSTLDAMGLDAGLCLCVLNGPGESAYSQVTGGEITMSRFDEIPLPPNPGETNVIGDRASEIAQRSGARAVEPAFPLAEAIARLAVQRKDSVGKDRPAPLYIRPANAAPAKDAPPVLLD